MSRCVLGKKKHRLCEDIADKEYKMCVTTRDHYIAECWYDERNADYVNYKVRHVWPAIRDGEYVGIKEEKEKEAKNLEETRRLSELADRAFQEYCEERDKE